MATLGDQSSRTRIYDSELEFKDAGALTESGAFKVDDATSVIDLGSNAPQSIDCVIDVDAIVINDNDELYRLVIFGADDAAVATPKEPLAEIELGALEVLGAGSQFDTDSDIGRYILPFRNERNGRSYRYISGYAVISGSTPSINFTAYLGMKGRD